jgi:hypothetical protein
MERLKELDDLIRAVKKSGAEHRSQYLAVLMKRREQVERIQT